MRRSSLTPAHWALDSVLPSLPVGYQASPCTFLQLDFPAQNIRRRRTPTDLTKTVESSGEVKTGALGVNSIYQLKGLVRTGMLEIGVLPCGSRLQMKAGALWPSGHLSSARSPQNLGVGGSCPDLLLLLGLGPHLPGAGGGEGDPPPLPAEGMQGFKLTLNAILSDALASSLSCC